MTKHFLVSKFMLLCYLSGLIMLFIIFIYPKGELELIINQRHSPLLDYFFKYITHLGDGIFLVLMLIALLFLNYTSAILTAFSIVFQSLFVSLFKRWIFKGLERPLAFFGDQVELNIVEGVDVHSTNTFPSGHTATGFAIFALLFIIIKNRGIIIATMLFALAFLVGFSRVYLLQHFIVDVYFGAIFGLLSVILGLYFLELFFTDNQIGKLNNTSLISAIQKAKSLKSP